MNQISQLKSLPTSELLASARVDFLHFIACEKPVVRTKLANSSARTAIEEWCAKYQYVLQGDDDGFACIARDQETVISTLTIDQSKEPHEQSLGELLGYPRCCCKFISTVGEARIDVVEEQMRQWSFEGRFQLINPSGYLSGNALICHLPCSTNCMSSLALAERAYNFIREHSQEPVVTPWLIWV